jgi:hypothetical protein
MLNGPKRNPIDHLKWPVTECIIDAFNLAIQPMPQYLAFSSPFAKKGLFT